MASNYYVTNAIYEYIESNGLSGYSFAKENIWMMIYGNGESAPKLLIVISAVSDESYKAMEFTEHETEIMDLCAGLSEASGLKYRVVRYRKSVRKIESLQYIDYVQRQYKEISAEALVQLFEDNGIQSGPSSKPINDQASSAFHEWQREHLGKNLTASDIDLIKTEEDGRRTIFELKRSHIRLEDWNPYGEDFASIKLVAAFAAMAGASFRIIYNRKNKTPVSVNDDISRLKRFRFFPEEKRAEYIDTVTPNEFFGGCADE